MEGISYFGDRIDRAWSDFIDGRSIDKGDVRSCILSSWQRSQSLKIDHARTTYTVPNSQEATRRMRARPQLYDYLTSQTFTDAAMGYWGNAAVLLTDARGYVLAVAGQKGLFAEHGIDCFQEGMLIAEDAIGTNAIGLTLNVKEPAFVFGKEHYLDCLKGIYCYAAPIFDHKNVLVAALCLAFPAPDPAMAPLSLVRLSAGTMGKQILLHHRYVNMIDAETCLDVLINTMNYGVLFLGSDRKVLRANSIARYHLLIYNYELMGHDIEEFISPLEIDFATLDKNIYNRTITVSTYGAKSFQFSVSVYLKEQPSPSETTTRFIITLTVPPTPSEAPAKAKNHTTARFRFDDIVGTAHVFTEALNLAKVAAKTNATILITGESGTGKELLAQSIHNASDYAGGPFVAINCGAIPRELIESELFGYEDGAFTGAKKGGVMGKLEYANGGTVFLDEIGDMPLSLQVSLLRFLQDREITRIGGKKPIQIDVRVIAATNKNLEEAVKNNQFRTDLYYRINIFNIRLPSLRERFCDIRNLAHYFLQKYKVNSNHIFRGFTQEAYYALESYPWPGNVREIENVIERAVLTANGEVIDLKDFPENLRFHYLKQSTNEIRHLADNHTLPAYIEPLSPTIPANMADIEKSSIMQALQHTGGNVKKAAETLGVSRRTLYRKLEKYEIDPRS